MELKSKFLNQYDSLMIPRIELFGTDQESLFYHKGAYSYALLKLGQMSFQDELFTEAYNYLNFIYPQSLDKSGAFIDTIKRTNKKIWKQTHLLLMYELSSQRMVAGSALITSMSPELPLALELELGIEIQRKTPSIEIGRLSIDVKHAHRSEILNLLLLNIYEILENTKGVENVFLYSKKTLRKLYERKGYYFKNLEQYSKTLGEDIISELILYRNK